MPDNEWTDLAAQHAAREAERRETHEETPAPPGGPSAPAEVVVPGRPEQEVRTPGREATPDVGTPRTDPERRVPGHTEQEPAGPEIPAPEGTEETELLGERTDYPLPYGKGEPP
jgi:hypothetical protein